MENLSLDRLKKYGKDLIKKIITYDTLDSSETMYLFLELYKNKDLDFKILDFEYYLPESIRFFDTSNESSHSSFSISMYGTIKSNIGLNLSVPYIDSKGSKTFEANISKGIGFISHIEVYYELVNEDEINILSVKLISNFYPNESKAFSDWKPTKNRIIEANDIVKLSPNSNLLEKIDAIEISEDLMKDIGEYIDDDLFLQKVELLQKVAEFKNPKRVYAEYGSVANITNQPVLMNKALSIFLNKEQVLGLIQDLSQKYKNVISNIRYGNINNLFKENNYVVPVVFGKTERGHADSDKFQIVLPKLGDWRTGYKNLYTSELVFHEFSHILDSDRRKTISGKANFDVHRHEFVDILDSVLIKYRDFINERYSTQMFRDMILNINTWMDEFKITYEERIRSIKLQEKNRRESIQEMKEEENSSLGITENSFPLNVILTDNKLDELNFLLFSIEKSLNKNIPDYQKSPLLTSRIKILDAIDGVEDNIMFNKDEMNMVKNAVNDSDINNWISLLPNEKQVKLLNPINEFKQQIYNLSINNIKPKNKVKKENLIIEEYDVDPLGDYITEMNS